MSEVIKVIMLVLLYLQLGNCWANIMEKIGFSNPRRPRCSYAINLLLWPVEIIMLSGVLDDEEEDE